MTRIRTRLPAGPDLFTPVCSTCERPLVPTPSGYLACPAGHGRLVTDPAQPVPDDEPSGLWFPDEPGPVAEGEPYDGRNPAHYALLLDALDADPFGAPDVLSAAGIAWTDATDTDAADYLSPVAAASAA